MQPFKRGWVKWMRGGRVLAAGFATLSLFIAASVILYVQQQAGDAVVRRALQIEIAFADVFSGLQDAEIGQRGYLLTGDDAFLQPYNRGGERLARHMTELGGLIAGIEDLAAPFATLRSLTSAKQAELAQSITLYRSGQATEALALVRGGSGKQVMDQIREVIAAMDAREDAVVERRQTDLRRVGTLVASSITVALVLLGLVALEAMREVARRSQLSRFLPAEVADRLAAGDLSLQDGRELPAAIVFVDIRGSTELAEGIAAADLSRLLSGFRADVLAAAEANGGLVDKFIGDGALIVFGVHDPDAKAAAQAIGFAHELRRRHHAARAGRGQHDYDIGMGIHHGIAFCGILGTAGRLEFTVLGDVVNVAARLEKETKVYGVDLLVSGAVLETAAATRAEWRELGCDVLRGRRSPITLFTDREPVPP